MQERHKQRDRYFEEQAATTAKHVIPYIEDLRKLTPETEILEIGCGEGGNLKPFLDAGCKVTGVDILETKIKNAERFYEKHPLRKNLSLITSDIYHPPANLDRQFDVVFMRDVLEHIHNQEKFLNYAKRFLKPGGMFFLGFPPWQNPFGGHQQMCHSKFLSKLPWFHLLPGRIYPWIMRAFNEPEYNIEALMEIKQTRISIERFRRIIRREKYPVLKRTYWFINPNYEIKFGLKPRKMPDIITQIPVLRNFVITTCYYILGKD